MAQRRDRAATAPKYLSKSGLAREHIQQMILSGDMREGQQVTAREISEILDISETPVREAISSLAAEGWLDFKTHHRAVVAKISVEQIGEINALRGMLSALAVRRGGKAYGSTTVAALERNIAASALAAADGDSHRYAQLNREFHMLICDTPYTQWTLRLLSSLSSQTAILRRGFAAVPSHMKVSLKEHRAILATIRARDFQLAAELLIAHEQKASDVLVAALTQSRRASTSVRN